MAFKSRSNVDHTRLISKFIFITNFPDVTTSKDLWVLCQSYGTVVNVFIPNCMSKAGKRFAFVRFIKVDNVERLVGNLCTLWIGRKHLQANLARFDRDSIPSKRVPHKFNHVAPTPTSFVSIVKGISSPPIPLASSPALVLDDSCMVARDLDNFVMGEVMIKLGSAKTKRKFMKHTGVASWFVRLCNAQNDFVASDRIVWVDIKGVPLHVWSHATFHKIGSQWGEVMELEDGNEDLFSRKRLCIKTKHANNILDSFKIIVKGKVFQIRAKKLFVWSPSFKEVPEVVHCSDDESLKDFDELMSTPIDFFGYILNGLKIENLTQEILLGPAFGLLKGTHSNYGMRYGVFHIGENNVSPSMHMREALQSRGDVYLQSIFWHVTLSEGDFPRLRINDIEDMLILMVQNRLTNLSRDDVADFARALRMFTRSLVIQKRVENLQLGVESYQKKINVTKPDTTKTGSSRKGHSYTHTKTLKALFCARRHNQKYRHGVLTKEKMKQFRKEKSSFHDQGHQQAAKGKKNDEEFGEIHWW
ncbi:RNA-directed DNA polymerase, eukaryota [Tanacetum coccineum]